VALETLLGVGSEKSPLNKRPATATASGDLVRSASVGEGLSSAIGSSVGAVSHKIPSTARQPYSG